MALLDVQGDAIGFEELTETYAPTQEVLVTGVLNPNNQYNSLLN
jgi:hypothetical protein